MIRKPEFEFGAHNPSATSLPHNVGGWIKEIVENRCLVFRFENQWKKHIDFLLFYFKLLVRSKIIDDK